MCPNMTGVFYGFILILPFHDDIVRHFHTERRDHILSLHRHQYSQSPHARTTPKFQWEDDGRDSFASAGTYDIPRRPIVLKKKRERERNDRYHPFRVYTQIYAARLKTSVS